MTLYCNGQPYVVDHYLDGVWVMADHSGWCEIGMVADAVWEGEE